MLPVVGSSIPTVLRERASLHPNGVALTYIDYERGWDGAAEDLTWAQLYRRMQNAADQLRLCGSPGDRAVILAPQGLEYAIGFLGALQAGLVAVPLSVPFSGAHDERTVSVLCDTSPAVVLTTSSAVENVNEYLQPQPGQKPPSIVEIDLLDLGFAAAVPNCRLSGGSKRRNGTSVSAIHVGVNSHAGRRHDFKRKRLRQFRTVDVRLLWGSRKECLAGLYCRVVAAVLP